MKERVRDAIDIVQVIGERVPLRRAGRARKGICPFHQGSVQSLIVDPDRQLWSCFVCNHRGDVFAFLMQHDNVTFRQALEVLAARAGVVVPQAAQR